MKTMLKWFKNLFIKHPDKHSDVSVEVEGETNYPVFFIKIGWYRIRITTSQAQRLWGKLGSALEKITPDK